jgi:3-phosphoshikimate 1-carboxyvinyltransferase
MTIIIEKSVARGAIMAPPSKSYARGLLPRGALAQGESEIKGVIDSEDMLATLDVISALGANAVIKNQTAYIKGAVLKESKGVLKFNCRESGSTLRFIIPIALTVGGVCEFYGSERLLERGVSVYEELFNERGIEFKIEKDKITANGKLASGIFNVPGNISSQFISGLLFALPLLTGDSVINITTELESARYIDLTLDAISAFGVQIEKRENGFFIKGGQKYKPCLAVVEGDMSNAAFLEAFNHLGGCVSVLGLNKDSKQADSVYCELFNRLKAGYGEIDVSSCPDLAPILFAVAAIYDGAKFIGTRRLKIKESDRADAMARELSKLGALVEVFENSVVVKKSKMVAPKEPISSHNDHRIVMSMAVLLSHLGGEIQGCEAVSKSYPDFFSEISKIGIRCEEVYNENNK